MASASNPLENFEAIAANGFTTPSFATPNYGDPTSSFTEGALDQAGLGVLGFFSSGAATPIAIVQSGTLQAQAATGAANTEASGIVAATQNAVSGFFLGLLSTRIIAIVLGLIFIFGAFLLFVGDDISDGLKKSGIANLTT